MNVQGTAYVSNGAAVLYLQPAPVDVVHVASPRPTLDVVQKWPIHPSRQPVTHKVLSSAVVTVQSQLSLPRGLSGVWTEEATARLETLLAKPKKGAPNQGSPTAKALEDEKGRKRARSSSASSSSSSRASQASGAKGSGRSSSSSSSSESDAKEDLQEQVKKLRAELDELYEAIGSRQQIEEENKAKIRGVLHDCVVHCKKKQVRQGKAKRAAPHVAQASWWKDSQGQGGRPAH